MVSASKAELPTCDKSKQVSLDLSYLCFFPSSSYNKRQFVTTTSNMFQARPNATTSNPGIISEITKR